MSVEADELRIPVVWSPDCLLHEPGGEVWLGLREAGTEVPQRATAILRALRDAGAPVLPASRHEMADLHSVHHPDLVRHLAGIWADWEAGGYVAEHGRDRVVPYVFPTAAMLAGLPGSVSEAEDAVQETWLRYQASPAQPTSAKAFLSPVVTRISAAQRLTRKSCPEDAERVPRCRGQVGRTGTASVHHLGRPGRRVPGGRYDALVAADRASAAAGAESAARSRYGSSAGPGGGTAPELGAGFGLRGSRTPAPPPRPR